MSYEALPKSAYPLLYIYSMVILLGYIFVYSLTRRYFIKKSPTTKNISLAVIFYAIAITLLFLGLLEGFVTGYKKEIYRITFGLGQASLAISNVFLILFVEEIFGLKRDETKKYQILFIILSIILILPNNYYGYPPDSQTGFGPSIRLYTSAAFVVFSIFLHWKIGNKCVKVAKRIDDNYGKVGLTFIGVSQFGMVLVYIFMVIDTIIFTFTDNSAGYSVLIFLAWITVGFVLLFLYLGFILPSWLRKRAELENIEKNESKTTINGNISEEENSISSQVNIPKNQTAIENASSNKLNIEQQLEQLDLFFSISKKIKINDISSLLGLKRSELLQFLIEKKNELEGFEFEKDFIIIKENGKLNSFMGLIDGQFNDWVANERKIQGKI
jgi:hypothetical protein